LNPATLSGTLTSPTGQVQSVINDRITVNFEHMGKVVIIGSQVLLEREYSK
jgi:hypothetical protein